MAAKDTNSDTAAYLQAQYVATWAAGKNDLNTLLTRRVTVTATTGEMTARVLAAIVLGRNAA